MNLKKCQIERLMAMVEKEFTRCEESDFDELEELIATLKEDENDEEFICREINQINTQIKNLRMRKMVNEIESDAKIETLMNMRYDLEDKLPEEEV